MTTILSELQFIMRNYANVSNVSYDQNENKGTEAFDYDIVSLCLMLFS